MQINLLANTSLYSKLVKNMASEKIVAIMGSGMAGKTCLAKAYQNKSFDECRDVFYDFCKELVCNGKTSNVKISKIPGQEDYEHIHKIFISRADVIILCYSVICKDTYQLVEVYWKEVLSEKQYSNGIILVATHLDMRDNNNSGEYVTRKMGEDLKKRIGAIAFFECSSKSMVNIDAIFELAMHHIFAKRSKISCSVS